MARGQATKSQVRQSKGLCGVTWMPGGLSKTGGRKRRKPTLEDLHRTRQACERSAQASNELRADAGLDPVPSNFYRDALAAEIARRETDQPKPARKPTRKEVVKVAEVASQGNGSTPTTDVFRMFKSELQALGTPEALAELERRKQKRAAKRETRQAVAA